MSLWAVDEISSSILMQKFYEALKDASPFLASRLASKIEDYKAFIKST